MNHSRRPNVRMRLATGTEETVVQWSPMRPIARGEELLYAYGKPDPAWTT
jgi:hypothetical protein